MQFSELCKSLYSWALFWIVLPRNIMDVNELAAADCHELLSDNEAQFGAPLTAIGS